MRQSLVSSHAREPETTARDRIDKYNSHTRGMELSPTVKQTLPVLSGESFVVSSITGIRSLVK